MQNRAQPRDRRERGQTRPPWRDVPCGGRSPCSKLQHSRPSFLVLTRALCFQSIGATNRPIDWAREDSVYGHSIINTIEVCPQISANYCLLAGKRHSCALGGLLFTSELALSRFAAERANVYQDRKAATATWVLCAVLAALRTRCAPSGRGKGRGGAYNGQGSKPSCPQRFVCSTAFAENRDLARVA
jgi:hypothetical protein